MADVLIRGLEMPKNGERTTITVYGDGVWCVHYNNEPHGKAIPLPAGHGRLIDADAMLRDNPELADCDFIHPKYDLTLRELIEDAHTIVPAEGGEGDA